jgi:hypothetical protein
MINEVNLSSLAARVNNTNCTVQDFIKKWKKLFNRANASLIHENGEYYILFKKITCSLGDITEEIKIKLKDLQ